MQYTIEPLTISDYEELYSMWKSLPGIGLSSSDEKENIALFLDRNPGASFIARCGGEIAGAVLCGNDGRRAYIHHTAVALKFRKNGVGSALVRAALEKQRELKIKKCHIFVFTQNDEGRMFWEKMGFGVRGDLFMMSKEI